MGGLMIWVFSGTGRGKRQMCIGYVTPLTCKLHCLFWNTKREETRQMCIVILLFNLHASLSFLEQGRDRCVLVYFTPINCMLHCLYSNRKREETDVYWLVYSFKLHASLPFLEQEGGKRYKLVSVILLL